MKRHLLLFFLLLANLQLFAQYVTFDIFDDLKHESRDRRYTAYLKKNIFDDLTFSDSNNNKVVFNKKYLDLQYRKSEISKESKIILFKDLISEHRGKANNDVKYSVDIFDKVIIERNGDKVETGKDIFGNNTYEESVNGEKYAIKKDLAGSWNFDSRTARASLKKDIFDKWNYNDSSGSSIEFSEKSWRILLARHGSEEYVLLFLINSFLLY